MTGTIILFQPDGEKVKGARRPLKEILEMIMPFEVPFPDVSCTDCSIL